jgi:hypothetical protein
MFLLLSLVAGAVSESVDSADRSAEYVESASPDWSCSITSCSDLISIQSVRFNTGILSILMGGK